MGRPVCTKLGIPMSSATVKQPTLQIVGNDLIADAPPDMHILSATTWPSGCLMA